MDQKTLVLNNDKGAAIRNSFGNVEFNLNQTQSRKLPFFWEMSNILDVMYLADGVFPHRTTQQWRSVLMSSGWAAGLDSIDIRRLTLLHLRNMGRGLWDNVSNVLVKRTFRLAIQCSLQ